MYDKKNIATLIVLKSVEEDEMYFSVPAPKTADRHVRLDMKRGFHYFQVLDDKRTRYVSIFNSDPKLPLMPNWAMNFIMTKICY